MCVQSCLTLCDSMDCSLPGSSVHGILQARILEWVAISFSRGSSRPRDQTWVSGVSWVGRWILYHWHSWVIIKSISLLLSLENVRWGWKSQVSDCDLVFPEISPHPRTYQESPYYSKGIAIHPGNSKGFRHSVSETGVRDQILEQKMLLVLLSCGEL